MPLKEKVLQNQLERAKARLAAVEKRTEKIENRRRAKWRHAQARIRQIEERIASRSKSVAPAGGEEAAAE